MTDSVELARYTPVRPLPVHEVARAMHEYQQGIAAVVDASDWQVFVDRGGGDRRFLKRSGWRKIATWFGLDLLVGSAVVERDEQGRPLGAPAKTWARARSTSGTSASPSTTSSRRRRRAR
jgi:hypothetical protein